MITFFINKAEKRETSWELELKLGHTCENMESILPGFESCSASNLLVSIQLRDIFILPLKC